MILTTARNISPEQLNPIQDHLDKMGMTSLPIRWKGTTLFVLGKQELAEKDLTILRRLGVRKSIILSKQYKLVSREFDPADSIISIGTSRFGGKEVPVIAGPCSVESAAQMHTVAEGIQAAGCRLLRGGAYKPRSSPYSFQGHGIKGLELLCAAARPRQLPIVSEIMDPRNLDAFLEYKVDALQVGTRNMQNFDLLKELGRIQTPVILKRGMSATMSEWLMAAEYIASGGNPNIILCERGIRTFETAYRNVLDVTSVIVAKKETHLPVIVDPSHAGGQAWMVPALSHAAVAVGADGLLIEVHPDPQNSWCDAEQAITIAQVNELMPSLDHVAHALGRTIFKETTPCA